MWRIAAGAFVPSPPGGGRDGGGEGVREGGREGEREEGGREGGEEGMREGGKEEEGMREGGKEEEKYVRDGMYIIIYMIVLASFLTFYCVFNGLT